MSISRLCGLSLLVIFMVSGCSSRSEAVRRVASERAPVLVDLRGDERPFSVLHAGDLVIAHGAAGRTLDWRGSLE